MDGATTPKLIPIGREDPTDLYANEIERLHVIIIKARNTLARANAADALPAAAALTMAILNEA